MDIKERIKERAYLIYLETNSNDSIFNWNRAKAEIYREDYYRQLGKCPYCGTHFNKEKKC